MPASSSSPSSEPPLPGQVGRYEVKRLIGEGSMGRVLCCHDPVVDRDVAVKHLRGDLKIPREVRNGLVKRMRHEARAAGRVAHPNIVVLHDMGEDPDVGLYLVFEYVEGPTLKQRLFEGALPPAEVAKLAADLGAALTLAHEAGIVHRDVKPENVILARTGAKIADFGIARVPDSTLTHQGGLMGTPAYSAPETFRSGAFSPASDQFSLATTVYEALTGRRAFPGDDAVAVAAAIAHEDPEPFPLSMRLPDAAFDVLARGMSRRPEDRFPSCEAFGAALARALRTGSAVDPELSVPASIELPPQRRTGQVALGALVVVATAALLLRTALRSAEPIAEEPPRPAEPPTASAPPPSARPHPHPLAPHARHRSEPASVAPTASAHPSAAPLVDAGAPAPAADAGALPDAGIDAEAPRSGP